MAYALEFEALFRHAPIPMYLWIQKGDVFEPALEDFNGAALQLTAGRIVELKGKSYLALYAEDAQIQQDFRTCFLQQKPVFRKMKYRLRSNGEVGEFRVAYIPISVNAIVVAVVQG